MSNLSNVVPGAEGPGEYFTLGGAEPQGRASFVPGGVDLTAAGADFWGTWDEGGFVGRRGSVWTLSVGNDGRTWRVYAEVEAPWPATVWAGPAYTSHRAGTLGTAQFRELS